MKRKIFCGLCLLLAVCILTGCQFSLHKLPMPEIPDFGGSGSTLSGTVQSVSGKTCALTVTGGDSHFKEETEILVAFETTEGSPLSVGRTVTVTYDYVTQVSARDGQPLIRVDSIRVE